MAQQQISTAFSFDQVKVPPELWRHVFSNLGAKERGRLEEVSKRFHSLLLAHAWRPVNKIRLTNSFAVSTIALDDAHPYQLRSLIHKDPKALSFLHSVLTKCSMLTSVSLDVMQGMSSEDMAWNGPGPLGLLGIDEGLCCSRLRELRISIDCLDLHVFSDVGALLQKSSGTLTDLGLELSSLPLFSPSDGKLGKLLKFFHLKDFGYDPLDIPKFFAFLAIQGSLVELMKGLLACSKLQSICLEVSVCGNDPSVVLSAEHKQLLCNWYQDLFNAMFHQKPHLSHVALCGVANCFAPLVAKALATSTTQIEMLQVLDFNDSTQIPWARFVTCGQFLKMYRQQLSGIAWIGAVHPLTSVKEVMAEDPFKKLGTLMTICPNLHKIVSFQPASPLPASPLCWLLNNHGAGSVQKEFVVGLVCRTYSPPLMGLPDKSTLYEIMRMRLSQYVRGLAAVEVDADWSGPDGSLVRTRALRLSVGQALIHVFFDEEVVPIPTFGVPFDQAQQQSMIFHRIGPPPSVLSSFTDFLKSARDATLVFLFSSFVFVFPVWMCYRCLRFLCSKLLPTFLPKRFL